jgi:UDP-N-acetylmuramoyl-L-alanyl-D-glutamate--2,6-diaminopimelate ligase
MSVRLSDILDLFHEPVFDGDPSVPVRGVTHDSRLVEEGRIFVAVPGAGTDGNRYVADAIRKGAVAIISEKERASVSEGVAWIKVPDARKTLGPVSAVVYGDPSSRLTLVGITGTNGKTTLTYLLEEIITRAGGNPGVVGTVTYRWGGRERPAAHTTPEATELQAILSEMADDGVTHAIIEASSHGLVQGRLDGCRFDLGIFTNLSRDHLDFHRDMEDYFQAKRVLFTRLLPESSKSGAAAAVNLDDPYGLRLYREIDSIPVAGFGTSPECEFHPERVELDPNGISATVSTPEGPVPVRSALAGSFNMLNILAATAAAVKLGLPIPAISEGIEAVRAVPGRLERVPSDKGTIFVDYAHTPDALKNVLEAIRRVHEGRIITIMGCGGDRDKAKRPLMGAEAALGSDFVVVTSDNPRTEDPAAIIEQVVEGVNRVGFRPHTSDMNGAPLEKGRYRIISDRGEAIAWAVGNVREGDVLLVAGKGHETYQEINGVRRPFDDRRVVLEELRGESRVTQEETDPRGSGSIGK